MTTRKKVVLLSTLYLAVAGVGTYVAVSRNLSARPFGIATGLPVIEDFVFGLGTALSAPSVVLLLLIALNVWMLRSDDRRPVRLIAILAGGVLIGMLGEPILGEALNGSHDLVVKGLIAMNLVTPLFILWYGRMSVAPRVRE